MNELVDKEPVDTSGEDVITALIDADSIGYIIGHENADSDSTEDVMRITDQFVSQILTQVQARQYAGFLSPKKTFRHTLYPEYKAKRAEPSEGIRKWRPFINEYLRQEWGFVEWTSYEADDAVAILSLGMKNTVVCSPDKDMKQLMGNHFDYKKGTRCYISEEEADYNFYYQLLMGDSGDGIPGAKGVGKKTAEKILNTENGQDMLQRVKATYWHVYGQEEGTKQMALNWGLISLTSSYSITTVQFLCRYLHTFDLDSSGTSSYLSSSEGTDADNLFDNW